jgi:DNA primase
VLLIRHVYTLYWPLSMFLPFALGRGIGYGIPMRYGPSILDEIKSRLPVSAVVGRRVKLTKAGREWKGLSPFNAERTPSFFVNDQKQAWFDFSSGRNGDIFTFLMEVEGLSFTEAVERLAAEAGVTLPKETPESEAREKQRAGLGEAMEFSAAFFRAELAGPRGRVARDYLAARGITPEVITKFGIGYAPNERFALRDHLAEKGVSIEVMSESGMLISGDDIAIPYDRFRDRVMFPIADAKGRIIAFGGRALQKDVPAKYLNSPETPLFHKGAMLYNLHRARKAAHEAGTLFIVEGYVDAIAMDRAGISHVVAPLGTALTEEQMAMIWRLVPEPILCFDGDKAGLRAAYRGVDIALPHLKPGKTLRFVFMPAGQDPDDLLRSAGEEALRAALANPRPLVDVLFEREVEKTPLETPEQRADCEKRLNIAVSQIQDEDLKRYYRQAMRERLAKRFAPPQREGYARNTGMRPAYPSAGGRGFVRNGMQGAPALPLGASDRLKRSALFRAQSGIAPREAALILAAIHHPAIIEAEAEMLAELLFESSEARVLRTALLDYAALPKTEADAPEGVLPWLAAKGLHPVLARVAEAAAAEAWALPGRDENHALLAWKEAALLHERQSFLNNEIDQISAEYTHLGGDERFERLKALLARREVVLDLA